ncbi:hypothetical protein [Acinetobacter venetianus]|uniref:hypothetical protein n=1 Tax=Acinetobacter venetianus TaxID=52133 RepID=UPI003A94D25A
MTKLDPSSLFLKGKIYKLNEDGTELEYPPRDYLIEPWVELESTNVLPPCKTHGCDKKVIVTDKGNVDYAWYYLTNKSDSSAAVTTERRWMYQGKLRTETVRYQLYPGEDREVFSFPRNQQPLCCIVNCSLLD